MSMDLLLFLFTAYGITFGLQNKLPFLYSDRYLKTGEPGSFLDKMLKCTYCTGFHAGWMTGVILWLAQGMPSMNLDVIPQVILWSFASAAFSYMLDTILRWFEESMGSE